jgi:hypothetical protein
MRDPTAVGMSMGGGIGLMSNITGTSNGNNPSSNSGEPSGLSTPGWNLPSHHQHQQYLHQVQQSALRDSVCLPRSATTMSGIRDSPPFSSTCVFFLFCFLYIYYFSCGSSVCANFVL